MGDVKSLSTASMFSCKYTGPHIQGVANGVTSAAGSFFTLLYYLPIYFQSVDDVSASESGIRNIPLVLGVCEFSGWKSTIRKKLTFIAICSIISGGLITAYGVYVPFLLAGSAIATIGAGLLYTLDIGSPSSHWIGYQALVGIGIGLSIQVPIIANQSFVKVSEISSVTAVTLCKYIVFSMLPLTGHPMTNSSFSLPNDRWRLLRIRWPNSLQQSAASTGPSSSPGCQSRTGSSHRCNRVARRLLTTTAPWHRACLHGRSEADIRTSNRICWSHAAYCVVCKVAECQTEASRCGCVIGIADDGKISAFRSVVLIQHHASNP